MKVNKIYQGHVLDVLGTFPASSIDCVITSPPYWGLRDYGIEPVIWDSIDSCKHEWGSELITKQSGGDISKHWKGNLGLEPDFNLYIKHLCDIFDEIKRVLKPYGTIWVNMGDCYNSSNGFVRCTEDWKRGGRREGSESEKAISNISQKCLCMIPQRFAIEMINRGWILRNVLIWHKPNCMPSSVKDRFTVDFEYVYFFVKKKR